MKDFELSITRHNDGPAHSLEGAGNLSGVAGSSTGIDDKRVKSYSSLQLFFLMRLSYFKRQKEEVNKVLDSGDWRMKLLNKAMYSTYGDCVEQRVGSEARLLLNPPKTSPA